MSQQKLYNSFKISRLIVLKYTVGLDEEEQLKLDAWLSENDANRELYARILDDKARNNAIKEINFFNVKAAKEVVHTRIAADKADKVINKVVAKPLSLYKLWTRIAVVAAAVAAIVFGVWFYTNEVASPRNASGNDLAYKNDVKPGSNKATITLGNGEIINLSDTKTGIVVGDKLAYNDGSTIANLSPSEINGVAREGSNNNNALSPQGRSLPGGERNKVQMLAATTPRGGTYQVTLPDGTRVWLNADSKISFPSQFSGKERKILLSGEAYFEVVKNKKMPFIVESKGQEVTVLGTHFNINSYADEGSTKTTLLEGAVKVAFLSPSGRDGVAREGNTNNSNPLSLKGSLPGGERSIVLKPGQQSVLTGSNQLIVKEVDVSEAIAWKEGLFVFTNEPIEDILKRVARWYDVKIIYDGADSKKKFSGGVSRYDNISKVLEKLELTGGISFKLEGRKVYVSK